jgi:hypothetical protein
MTDVLMFLAFGFIALVTLAYFVAPVLERREREMWGRLAREMRVSHRFRPTQKLIGTDQRTGMAIDEQSKRVCLISEPYGRATLKMLPYRDVLESEVVENGVSVTKTSRGSQVGGALLGGLVLGGVGAVIGGLSARKTTTNKVTSVDLRVVVNDTREPVHMLRFPNRTQADHWHALVSVIIRQADQEDRANANTSGVQNAQAPVSVADELTKLSALMEKGLITQGEFQAQKARLLS